MCARLNSHIPSPHYQARKESDASKTALRDKEASLQAALTKLGICVDEGKRLKHQCQLLECANAHNRLQSRMGASQTSATAAANAALISGERDQELFATGSAFSMSNSMELAGTSVSSDFLKRSSGSGPSPYIIGGNGNPSLDPLLNASSDFEGRKKEQQKYGLDAALNLQVTVDTIRQELHKEKVARGREKAAMSVAVEEAVARATFSETMLSDLKIRLTREKERRNTAEKEKDDMSAEQQLMTICIGQKEGRVRELQYEIELQKERTLRIEAEMEELTVTAVKEKSFMFNRTADLTECVSLMRMGIVEAQGELAVQTSVSGETAVRASRENERIEERLNGLVAEYEELWKHSQQQVSQRYNVDHYFIYFSLIISSI